MRAAIIYDCLFPFDSGGGERVYRAIAETLVRRGWDVDYLTRGGRVEADAEFRIVPIWTGDVHDDRGTRTAGSAVGFARAVRREMRRRRDDYDLVLASALPVLTLIAARAGLGRRRARRSLVGDWLEVWPLSTWRRYAGPLSGLAGFVLQGIGAYAAERATVNSAFTAKRLARLRRRLVPTVLGLVDLAGPAREAQAAGAPPRILAVARLIPDKRIDTLPAALARVRRLIPEARLEIIGGGDPRPVLAAAESAGVSDAVDVRGRVSDEDLDVALAGAAVLAVPSRREGFGIVVAEAAARGTPAAVLDAPDSASAELIEPGRNGVRVDGDRPEHMADALITVIQAGQGLRDSTSAWYRDASATNGLDASLDRLLSS